MNNVLNLALRQASRNLSIDYQLVEDVYKSYWLFMKEHIANYVMYNMTEEEFNSINANFNIPYIGKLYASYDKIQKYKNELNYLKNVKAKENQANGLSSVSD